MFSITELFYSPKSRKLSMDCKNTATQMYSLKSELRCLGLCTLVPHCHDGMHRAECMRVYMSRAKAAVSSRGATRPPTATSTWGSLGV